MAPTLPTLPLPLEEAPAPPSLVIVASTVTFQTAVPLANKESPPDLVTATYTDDLNILKIHEAIAARFGSLRGQIPNMRGQILALHKKLEFKHWSMIERKDLVANIKALETEIATLECGTRWIAYITAAKPILEAYVPLISDDVRGIVNIKAGGSGKSRSLAGTDTETKDQVSSSLQELITKRIDLIQQYLAVAGPYITLDISWQGVVASKCPGCDRPFTDLHVDDAEGLHSCECGYERENLAKGPSFKDALRVNVGGRNEYEDRETFDRALSRIEGTYPDKIPDLLYSQLDAYFTFKGFYTGAQIRELPLLPNGRKQHTSVTVLISGLAETNNADFYKCYPLIAHNYWGWALRDFTTIRARVMQEYDLTQSVYNVIKERDSSLNVNIRVYYHLRAVSYPCEWEDFKSLTARDSLLYHQKMWKEMCRQTGVVYTDIV